jgi:hypothetical protein
MKLNPDCVHDILLSVEEICTSDRGMNYNGGSNDNPKLLNKYSCEEIIYHVQLCEKYGLILNVNYRKDDSVHILIKDLSPQGHTFIANVRKDDVWNETKSIAEKVGSLSLPTLAQISDNIITKRIESQDNLN